MPFPFRDRTLQFETLRALGYANAGGADVNEIFQVCGRIREGNLDDWFREWQKAGQRALCLGRVSESVLDNVSAKQAYLRASNYLRTAEFFRRDSPLSDQEALKAFDDARNALYRALFLTPEYEFLRFEVPFDSSNMPAYLVRPTNRSGRLPTIVVNGGFDGSKEESFLAFGAAALARGYNFVGFDGPGQGEMIRHRNIPFRPDWHVVVTAITDAIIAIDGVDPERLVLLGWSMGGWLAAQAATEEHRYRALVLNDGVFDFAAGWRKRIPSWIWILKDIGYRRLVSSIISMSVRVDIGQTWALRNALFTFAATDGAHLLDKIIQYSLTPESAKKIQSPMLILDPENDHLLGGQPQELIKHFDEVQNFRHTVFESQFGAGEHCHMGAMAEQDRVIFNWLAETL